jgi:outer membrane murein-binding lipoprotein Lpp
MKLAIFLGIALLLVVSAFAGYRTIMVAKIEKLEIELQTALNNQQVLENTVKQQNDQIVQALETAKKTQQQIQSLNTRYSESQAQVTNLRNKFAKHNLEGMALAKPALLEGKINKASARVLENLNVITNPDQFDEELIAATTATVN